MLTKKAARQLLDGLNAEDDHMNCYCVSDECTLDKNHIEDDGGSRPRFGIAYVTPDGQLDHAANIEAHGWKHGGLVSDAHNVLGELEEFAEYIEDRVVIDRETGQWWDGPAFPG